MIAASSTTPNAVSAPPSHGRHLILVSGASRAVLYVSDEAGRLQMTSALVRSLLQKGAGVADSVFGDDAFAARVCQELDEELKRDESSRVAVVAPRPFLRAIHEHLSDRVRQEIDLYVEEDLTQLSPPELGAVIEAKLRQL